jgi:hypothetical protein
MGNKFKKNKNENKIENSKLSKDYVSLFSNLPILNDKSSIVSFIKKMSNLYKKISK